MQGSSRDLTFLAIRTPHRLRSQSGICNQREPMPSECSFLLSPAWFHSLECCCQRRADNLLLGQYHPPWWHCLLRPSA